MLLKNQTQTEVLGNKPMDKLDLATSPCDGLVASRRERRPGARLLPLNTQVLGRAMLDEQDLALESGSISLSLSVSFRYRPRCVKTQT